MRSSRQDLTMIMRLRLLHMILWTTTFLNVLQHVPGWSWVIPVCLCIYLYISVFFLVHILYWDISFYIYIYTHPPTFNQTIKNTYTIPFSDGLMSRPPEKIFSKIDIYIYTHTICFRLYTYTKVLCGSLNRWSHPMPTRQCSFVSIAAAHWSLVSHAAQRAAPKTMLNRKDGMPHHDLWLKC